MSGVQTKGKGERRVKEQTKKRYLTYSILVFIEGKIMFFFLYDSGFICPSTHLQSLLTNN